MFVANQLFPINWLIFVAREGQQQPSDTLLELPELSRNEEISLELFIANDLEHTSALIHQYPSITSAVNL